MTEPETSLYRLRWQCRRGMRELDILLNEFLEHGYSGLEAQECETFERLLGYPDSVLIEWLMGRMIPADRDVAKIVEAIRHTAVS